MEAHSLGIGDSFDEAVAATVWRGSSEADSGREVDQDIQWYQKAKRDFAPAREDRSPAAKRGAALRHKAAPAIMRGMGLSSGRRTQLLRGVLDLCLLAVMGDDPAYGYEMTKRLGERGLSIVGEGSIYPLLGRLERDGLVDTHRATSNGGPPRKYYRLSRRGRQALEAGTREWRATRDAVDAVLGLVAAEVQT
jgi:PadR family transcriptional regulator, regulatory protein PadR